MTKRAVLFVCLGNICRSPLAEAAFRAEVAARGLDATVDSAGTGNWHIGQAPDARAIATARKHGIDIADYEARQVRPEDFDRFDLILALDRENLSDLKRLCPAGAKARIELLLDRVPGMQGKAVPDPYYGGLADFERVWTMVCEAARFLAETL